MPTSDQHYKKALKNIDFYENISAIHPDWAMTGLFYSALHFVDSFLATRTDDGIHPENHDYRNDCVRKVSDLKPIYPYYRALQDFGHRARYKMDAFTQKQVDDANTRYLNPIKEQVDQLLGK